MDLDWDESDTEIESESPFRTALAVGRVDEARSLIERGAADPETPGWLVTSMLEDLGLWLAQARRYDEAIAAFERALGLGWDVVPDGRCEIARVLLLAGRHREADIMWAELREADPEGVWTLNAGGMAYGQVARDPDAVQWLGEGLRVAIGRDDPEHVVDQMSDVRRVSLRRLGQELDEREREVEAFRAGAAARRQEQVTELRLAATRAGVPVRGLPATVVWLAEADDQAARERWPGWADSLVVDEPFAARRERMERHLCERRAQGDGPLVVVTIDLDLYATWCDEHGREPIDRRSRSSFVEKRRALGEGRLWPPGRNEPCWCGSERKYKRCCGT
ncbi:MAG: SEC-C metal-binding domain-containing protein [Actinomycetota bacterium]|nr:SEC-C metal-binding domain-containing protein [Actinomycetota bacterium]